MFLRIMGACFLVGGLAFCILLPGVRLMGGIWVGVGVLLIVIAQVVAAGEAHRKMLLETGKQGMATIVAIADTGITVNNSPRARVTVRIEVPGEAPLEGTRGMMVSRVAPPRVGSTYSCRFDPKNPNDFVFEEREPGSQPQPSYNLASPVFGSHLHVEDDPTIKELERLTTLREKGALTSEEFEQQKLRILNKS